jgi:hypothetical protein
LLDKEKTHQKILWHAEQVDHHMPLMKQALRSFLIK